MLRKAGLEDVPALHRIERRCFGRRGFSRAHIVWTLKNPQADTFLYQEAGHFVGTVMVRQEADLGRIVSVAVLPERRGRGIGRTLMEKAEEVSRARGARTMSLEVSVNNEGAIGFYRTLGYGFNGLLRGYYSWGEDAHVMTKSLNEEGTFKTL